jgi:hypothetical protein
MAAAKPSLRLEGKGNLYIGGGINCPSTACPGTLTADLSGAPFGQAHLDLTVSVQVKADGFTGCRSVTGRGTLAGSQYTVTFTGEFCEPDPRVRYGLSGTMQIFAANADCAGTAAKAATGTLTVFGDNYRAGPTPPLPTPGPGRMGWTSGESLVTIVGISGSIPVCTDLP